MESPCAYDMFPSRKVPSSKKGLIANKYLVRTVKTSLRHSESYAVILLSAPSMIVQVYR
jgi:hypothetical protein